MADSKPQVLFTPLTEEENALHVNFLKTYLQDSIDEELQMLSINFKPDESKDLASDIVGSPDTPVKDMIEDVLNVPWSNYEQDKDIVDIIQRFADKHKYLKSNREFMFLLVSLPLDKQRQLGPSKKYGKISESSMRKEQMKHIAEAHPKMYSGDLDDTQSNALSIEISNEVDLHTALNAFVEKATQPPIKASFIIFNGHGTKAGHLALKDGGFVHMDTILENLQTFRQGISESDLAGALPELHIVFGQCFAHALDWKVAVTYNMLTDVVRLTSKKHKFTKNKRMPDGSVHHVQLMEWAGGAQHFSSIQKYKIIQMARQLEQLVIAETDEQASVEELSE